MTDQPDGPLLAVIDMQRVFAEKTSPWFVPGFGRIIKPVWRLVGAFGNRVAFTRFVVPDEPQGSWVEYYREWAFARRPASRSLFDLAEPWTATRANVIDKTTFSAFGTELTRLIGPSNELVLCGVSTECCVLATALTAVDAGAAVRIVSDACASVDEEAHASALRVATVGFSPMITITTTDEELEIRGAG